MTLKLTEKTFQIKQKGITSSVMDISELNSYALNQMSFCSRVCPLFRPAFILNGSFCLELDDKGIITEKEKPTYWKE